MGRLIARLTYLYRRRQLARDLADELESHRALRHAQLERSGLTVAEAETASRRALGNTTLAREDAADVWRPRWLGELAGDLRHGLRLLRRTPGFAAAAVGSLALGIGANTAIASLIDALVVKPLPVAAPEQLLVLDRINPRGDRSNFAYALFESVREPDTVLAGAFAALDGTYRLALDADAATPVRVQAVSGEYFEVLGIRASLGRLLTRQDERRGSPEPVAVVSQDEWRRRFHADRSIVGRRIVMRGHAITIVGVAPPGFFGESVGRSPDYWVPITMQPMLAPPDLLDDPRVGWLRVMARMRPGVDPRQAEAALNGRLHASRSQEGSFGQSLRQVARIGVEPGGRGLSDMRLRFSQQLTILMGLVALVLVTACANVANLLLVRGAARRRETAIRLAIGAGRGRLMRQFLAESLLLAAMGGAAGLIVAGWMTRLLLALASDGSTPVQIDVSPDLRMLGFTLAISLCAVVLFGVLPAAAAVRSPVVSSLKLDAIHARRSRPPLLVVAQVGLALVLVTTAALLLRTLENLRTLDLGFASESMVQVAMRAESAGYTREQAPQLYRRLRERIQSVPGIESASQASSAFGTGVSRTCCIAIEGRVWGPGDERQVATVSVTPDYFATSEIGVVDGRPFVTADMPRRPAAGGEPATPRIAIVNQAMARQFFGGERVVGRRFGWGDPPKARYEIEVVGVVRDAIYGDLRLGAPPLIYLPDEGGRYLVARAAVPASSAIDLVRREILAAEPSLGVDVQAVPHLVDRALLRERMLATLASFFAVVALVLAGIGLYGVMAYAVTCRTREIGIRIALGAARQRIVRQILGETSRLVMAGMLAGVAASLAGARLLAQVLFGVRPTDPATLGAALIAIAGVAGLAACVPALRATRVDPNVALRQD